MWCCILVTGHWGGWAGGLIEFDPSQICGETLSQKTTLIGWVMVVCAFNPSTQAEVVRQISVTCLCQPGLGSARTA